MKLMEERNEKALRWHLMEIEYYQKRLKILGIGMSNENRLDLENAIERKIK